MICLYIVGYYEGGKAQRNFHQQMSNIKQKFS